MIVEANAPGKMILFGEHSVVYGKPAIVLAIDRRAKVHADKRTDEKIFIDADDLGFSGYFENDVYHAVRGKSWRGRNLAALNVTAKKTMEYLGINKGVNLKVRSMIPIAVGLGSSAAICVATTAAVSTLFDANFSKEEIANLSFEGEKIIHGTPSGVDNNVSTYGGVMRYSKDSGFEMHNLEQGMHFIIGNTRNKRSTRMMVEKVAQLKDRNPTEMEYVLDNMGNIAQAGLEALMERDLMKIGDLMNINHGLLAGLGVSTLKLESLIHTARKNGALGAKLTGAGGGGCMIALALDNDISNIERAIRRKKSDSIRVNLTDKGVESKWVEESADS